MRMELKEQKKVGEKKTSISSIRKKHIFGALICLLITGALVCAYLYNAEVSKASREGYALGYTHTYLWTTGGLVCLAVFIHACDDMKITLKNAAGIVGGFCALFVGLCSFFTSTVMVFGFSEKLHSDEIIAVREILIAEQGFENVEYERDNQNNDNVYTAEKDGKDYMITISQERENGEPHLQISLEERMVPEENTIVLE